MKIAVLCLAHSGNAAGVSRIARYFAGLDANIFVHVDERTEISEYTSRARAQDYALASKRYPIYWGGFSLITATVGLIEDAMRAGAFDKYILLSEDSIPIVTRDILLTKLSEPIEWIDFKEASQNWILRRYQDFYSFDSPATCPRSPAVDQRTFDVAFARSIGRMGALMQTGKTSLRQLYHGSVWWALSGSRISDMLRIHFGDTRLRESFEFSANPDEQYMQTLYSMVGDHGATMPFMENDFSRSPKPYVYCDPSEIQDLRRRVSTLFLRKVPVDSGCIDDLVSRLM